ncbi:MAG TPA: inorganic phosphate transporter [Gemmataceae bacterium]|nr:inorganic phosphate transporter [Gemmataceae bacterium]
MSVLVTAIIVAVVFLAYSNGANDNFKGVATLFGSGTTNYRRAMAWATVTTLAGSLLALIIAQGLVDRFKGKGLVPDAVTAEPQFLLAVSLGAAATVILATWLGLPVSTTHALTGGLVGAGLLAAHGDVKFAALGSSFVLPLLVSPMIAIALTLCFYPLMHRLRRGSGVTTETCVCLGMSYHAVKALPGGAMAYASTGQVITVGTSQECVQRYQGRLLGLEAGTLLDALHYLSGGAVSFARGLNDTPKIVALLVAANALAPNAGLACVAVVMSVGGILNARRVAETMSRKITRLNPGQGFTANFITALLVAGASRFGLPVSTTHVSVGSLFGIGIITGTARKNTILSILLAWVTTLPLAALFALVIYLFLGICHL